MIRSVSIACLASVAFVAATAMSPAMAVTLTGTKYLKDASVSPAAARATAIKAFPGEVVAEELEHERGGSGLRYSFDIRNGKVTHEVGVDAKTGVVLENSVEGPDAD